MADFDRFPSAAPGKESRKAMLALVLGVVLISLLAYTYWKRTMQPPLGTPATADAALPSPADLDDMSDARLKEWQSELSKDQDPTRGLLLASTRPAPVGRTPRNPFTMEPAWVKALTKVVPPPPTSPPPAPAQTLPATPPKVVEPVVPVTTATKPQPLAVRAADYKLQSVLNGVGGWTAMINNRPVHAGEVIDQARVLEIHEDFVILQHKDFPADGPKTEISMPGRAGQ